MRAIVKNPRDANAAAVLAKDPRYNSTLRTTCVATRLGGGHAYNALPQTATANINCRIVPTKKSEEVRAALGRVVGDTGIKLTYTIPSTEKFGAAPSKVDSELIAVVTDLTTNMWGNIPLV